LTGVSNFVNTQHYGASLAQASFAAQRQNVGVSIGDETGIRDPDANGGLTGVSYSVNAHHYNGNHNTMNYNLGHDMTPTTYATAILHIDVDPDIPPDSTIATTKTTPPLKYTPATTPPLTTNNKKPHCKLQEQQQHPYSDTKLTQQHEDVPGLAYGVGSFSARVPGK
jgi:hypothetical protein